MNNFFLSLVLSSLLPTIESLAQWSKTQVMLDQVDCFAINGTNLFAGNSSGNGVFLSTNNGTNWTAVNNGLTDTYIGALAVKDMNLFAGSDLTGHVVISTNNGTSWVTADNGINASQVYTFAVNSTNLFAGTNGGVFLSTNNGTSWTVINTGLKTGTTIPAVLSLAIKEANLFAGVNGVGVFISTNNGTSWTPTSLQKTIRAICYQRNKSLRRCIYWRGVSINKQRHNLDFRKCWVA